MFFDLNLYNNYEYAEINLLHNALMCIPTVNNVTFSELSGKYMNDVTFFCAFYCDTKEDLIFLTRCIDRRYWGEGYKWMLAAICNDNKEEGIYFSLQTSIKNKKEILADLTSLVDNMEYHLNHQNYMKGFKLDKNKFEIKKKNLIRNNSFEKLDQI